MVDNKFTVLSASKMRAAVINRDASSINAMIYSLTFALSLYRYGPWLESPHHTSFMCSNSYRYIGSMPTFSLGSELITLLTVESDI